ncbi:MAG: oxidoreductase [Azospira oryzae]|jgi:photosystem II stability/assembly factor-like uncharacterized protein|nr:MAG: oxidoreductase [Azospira oryzae]
MSYFFSVLFLLLFTFTHAHDYQFHKVNAETNASFRGLSVVNDTIAWISGSQGQVGVTADGGKTWRFNTVKGHEKSEFRSLYAFDARRAIIANAGSPAYILTTADAGKTWKTVHTLTHKDAFFDGIDFWNSKEGIIYGDPIDGKMLLLKTTDGGLSWKEITNAPRLETGEASFAASGTGIRCLKNDKIIICTGGTLSRLWISDDKGEQWTNRTTPIIQGQSTTGIFSFAQNGNQLLIVGGDFKEENGTTLHCFYSTDDGANWVAPLTATRGYRECIEPITETILIATGPSGSDISLDNGQHWQALSDEKGLHTIRKARNGKLVIAAGGSGKIFLVSKK